MLKLVYKIMLVSFLSGSLMLMDFSFKGIQLQTVQAESVKTDGIDDNNLMATLTMTAVGLLASRLMQYKTTPDMMVAAAGGVAFIAGEIMATSKLKKVAKDLETEITRDSKGKVDNQQIELLEKLRKSYEEAKKTANTKKQLQTAAAAAFAAAGIMSYYFSATEMTAMTTCSTAVEVAISAGFSTCITSSAATCAGPQYAACFPPLLAACQACATAISTNHAGRSAYFLDKEVPQPSMSGMATILAGTKADEVQIAALTGTCLTLQSKPMQAAVTASCPTVPVLTDTYMSAGEPTSLAAGLASNSSHSGSRFLSSILNLNQGPIEIQNVFKNENLFQKIAEFIFPTANASLLSPMGIASSAAITFVLATSTSLAMELDMMLLSPKNRGIIFGVLAGMAYMAASATQGAIDKIDQNIKKIDRILNEMYGLKNGNGSTNPDNGKPKIMQNQNDNFKLSGLKAQGNESEDISGNSIGGTPCFTKEEKGKCSEFGEETLKSQEFASLPQQTQNEIRNYAKLAEGLNKKGVISGGTLDAAAKLGGQANALRANLAKLKKEADSKFVKNKKTKSIADTEKNFLDKVNGAVTKNLKNSKMSAGQMMASFGSGSMYNSGGEKPDSSLAGSDSSNKVIAAPAIDIGASSGVAAPDLGAGDQLADNSMSDEEKNAALAAANEHSPSIEDYDLKNDISKDKDTSIFELISNRYQKSGYQRLFKRVK
jgi:hypothetical protein